MKSDRRVQYTRRTLQESLVALMQEKPLQKISVKEICARADINRSTFYVHFGSPEEVFGQSDRLSEIGLSVPPVTALMARIKERGADIRTDILNIGDAKKVLLDYLKKSR